MPKLVLRFRWQATLPRRHVTTFVDNLPPFSAVHERGPRARALENMPDQLSLDDRWANLAAEQAAYEQELAMREELELRCQQLRSQRDQLSSGGQVKGAPAQSPIPGCDNAVYTAFIRQFGQMEGEALAQLLAWEELGALDALQRLTEAEAQELLMAGEFPDSYIYPMQTAIEDAKEIALTEVQGPPRRGFCGL